MKKLVLFDIDGTILLSSGAGRRAIIAALSEDIGAHESWERVRFDGKTDPQILLELLEAAGHGGEPAEDRIRALGRKYVSLLREELARPGHRTTLMPGILPLLDRVDQERFAVPGLLTGNFAEGAALKLESGGIDPRRFKVGAYGSDSPRRAELPPIAAQRAEPIFGRIPSGHDVVIVGDTPADVTCGKCIGARAIGVATGAYSTAELQEAGAHAVFSDLSETDLVMAAIFGD
jgi:phosphoglycolate phosphatase